MSDQTASADATSAAADATSTQSQATGQAAAGATDTAATSSATDDTDGLGDTGKRALDRMKAERDAAKREAKAEKDRADALETATKSETQQAIDKAKKDGSAEATAKYAAAIRRSEVKAALTAAGLTTMLDLAIRADEFVGLEVDDEGNIAGLDAAVETFKKAHGELFKAPVQPGTSDGGSRGSVKITKEQATAWAKDPAEYEKHREEILAAMAK